jgi:hypothetical protein
MPKRRWMVVASALFLFLTAPLAVYSYYTTEFDRGAYPPEADSMGIPIIGFAVGLLITSPFLAGLVWYGTRRYRASVGIMAWAAEAPVRSGVWSMIYGGPAVAWAREAVILVGSGYGVVAVHALACAYLALVLRAGAVGGMALQGGTAAAQQ